jgi:hypothetical protein
MPTEYAAAALPAPMMPMELVPVAEIAWRLAAGALVRIPTFPLL